MREKTLKAVCMSAAFLAGAFVAKDVAGILTGTAPAVIGGLAGAVFPEWDNTNTEFVGGPGGHTPSLRLGNLLNGGNPVLKDVRKKYLTDEEKALAARTTGGLRYETHSLLAMAVAALPLFGIWMLLNSLKPTKGIPADAAFGVMAGFVTAYAANIILTAISHGTFSRNGVRLFWPIPVRICIPIIHSEELIPDGGGVKDRRGVIERAFSVTVSVILIASAIVVLCIRTDLADLIKNAF